MKSKIGIVITDGVGYRNFVLSDFFQEAKKQNLDLIIFSCLPKEVYLKIDDFDIEIVELSVFNESFINWFFRKTKEVAHLQLYKNGNFGITDGFNANFSKSKTPRGIATRFIFKITSFFNSELCISRFNKLQQLSFSKNKITKEYFTILKDYRITCLFFTHQRPPYIAPLIFAAQKLNIKTIAFIFSWDNLASKGRMAGYFDKYFVWSDLMKKDLLEFYQNVNDGDVFIVGTPQFEPYKLNRYGYSKEKFCEKFKLTSNIPTILFSCGDVSTSPNDTVYIESIAEAILNNELIKKVNFLVRTSPAETPLRFEYLANKYPFIGWNYPKWVQSRSNHQESWSQRIPTIEDVNDLKSVLQHSDININMLSTMSLDFMLFNKPVINTVFGNENNGLANDQRFLKYRHIEEVINSNATYIAKNRNELINFINLVLVAPNNKNEEQLNLIKLQIGVSVESTSKTIVNYLNNII